MEFKVILFDLDGTLLDTLDDLGNSVNRVLAEKGFPTHDLDRYRSNKPHKFTKQCVDELLPNWKFEIVLGQRDTVPRKPSPEGALEIAEHLNTKPENVLYLGDSAVDMQTAVAAGMFPAGVLWGFRSAKELQNAGAKALIERPSEILSLLR